MVQHVPHLTVMTLSNRVTLPSVLILSRFIISNITPPELFNPSTKSDLTNETQTSSVHKQLTHLIADLHKLESMILSLFLWRCLSEPVLKIKRNSFLKNHRAGQTIPLFRFTWPYFLSSCQNLVGISLITDKHFISSGGKASSSNKPHM